MYLQSFQLWQLSIFIMTASSETETSYLLNNTFQFFFLLPTPCYCILLFCPESTLLGTSYKWTYTIFAFSCLTYFSQHTVFEVYLYCCMNQNFISYKTKILCCIPMEYSVYAFIWWWILELFLPSWLLWVVLLWTLECHRSSWTSVTAMSPCIQKVFMCAKFWNQL